VKRLVTEMPDAREIGPLAPDGSVARKSHGNFEIVASRVVGSPANSAADNRPTREPIVAGTTNRTVHAPFHANAGGLIIRALSTRALWLPTSLYR